jgi:hypothetical protein
LPIIRGPSQHFCRRQKRALAKDANVLLTGKRLQITAQVDAAGLATLKRMLDKYEEILKLVE